ncbi:MAG: long-chain fatty acid--CoA ligase [Clostridiales bacterium]|nr:long-chain fatty acid--CoA ligase [Clostridiales bacterium]
MIGENSKSYNFYDNFKVNFSDEETRIDRGVKRPWISSMGEIPFHIELFKGTIYERVEETARKYPDLTAYEFMDRKVSYKNFIKEINDCAKSLKVIGIKPNEKVAICMPNLPQAIITFYAVNLVGAISVMIHPLSAKNEIENYLIESDSAACIALDMAYDKFSDVKLSNLVIASVKDVISPFKKIAYSLTEGKDIKKISNDANIIWWESFLKLGKEYKEEYIVKRDKNDPAVMLFSGGTTGKPKVIVISNYSINAIGAQIVASNPVLEPGDKLLAIMPLFHGYGLGGVHTMMTLGGQSILIPRFEPQRYADLINKYKPNLLAGVPALYEVFIRMKGLEKADLSFLKCIASGGDAISPDLKLRLDEFLKERGCSVKIREGYGLTESMASVCSAPLYKNKEGSIGIPLPDMYFKICKLGTDDEVNYGVEGEICLTGPTIMLGYYKDQRETKKVMHIHEDGYTWLHTGDLGSMDEDGFIYFTQRIKRLIVTNGYTVYPAQIEAALDSHEKVYKSCVVGIPDEVRGQKIKAYLVLAIGVEPTEDIKNEILKHCNKRIAKYAWPKTAEFKDEFPKTLIGKVDYRSLEG